jgi:hypothetical protein
MKPLDKIHSICTKDTIEKQIFLKFTLLFWNLAWFLENQTALLEKITEEIAIFLTRVLLDQVDFWNASWIDVKVSLWWSIYESQVQW